MDIEGIVKHNTEVILSNKNDTHNELNFWFDHHYALQNIEKDKMSLSTWKESDFVQNFITENNSYKPSPAIPCCAIQFSPCYIAYYIYLLATKQLKCLDMLIENAEGFAINLEESDITEKHYDLLEEYIEKQKQKILESELD